MKLLIVSNCNNSDPLNLEDCTTRIELFILLLKMHLTNIEGIEVIARKCYPCITMKSSHINLYINQFPVVDHTLFIDDTGFYKKNSTFIDQLRKVTKYSIFTFCNPTKFSTCEDITFTFDKNTHSNKLFYIPPPLNDTIYAPRKDTDSIYILLNKPPSLSHIQKTDIPFILNKISKLISNDANVNIVFKIGLINSKSIDFIDTDNNIIETKQLPMYIDFVYELSKANMFFMTSISVDTYLLYELAMCNTLIISKDTHIDKHITDELKVHTYNNKFKWDNVFNDLLTYNVRSTLINNNCSWNNVAEIIINKLQVAELQMGTKEINIKPTYKKTNIIKYLNIKDKNKPCMNEMLTTTSSIVAAKELNKTKDLESRKPPIFLQSQLLK